MTASWKVFFLMFQLSGPLVDLSLSSIGSGLLDDFTASEYGRIFPWLLANRLVLLRICSFNFFQLLMTI